MITNNQQEIESLKAQKKELEKRIRELEDNGCHYGCAEIRVEHLGLNVPDKWSLVITSKNLYGLNHKPLRRSIVIAKSQDDIINAIPEITNDLLKLYEKVKDESYGQKSETA